MSNLKYLKLLEIQEYFRIQLINNFILCFMNKLNLFIEIIWVKITKTWITPHYMQMDLSD